ncbi:hypothetical protein RRU01S_28_00040 [Agrobacterium rubi TR3 = NBRC 13261]|uniref:Uncharacterized protein n=1 Tax=Agrobacterium rubi TR3 = NBRC 13261 TaxID=1368415 RepID=A0A081D1G5_9HYPH|nr:hypothetical protein RRU01S_28_00040 [Agrobacterium rubi TR3 = NBRC 13261]
MKTSFLSDSAAILDCHNDDPKAAIKAMQDEIEHLRQQLSLAVVAVGRGYTRGWVPGETGLVNEAFPARQSKQQD